MTDYKSTEVYNYLSYLEHYLNGDLKVFHMICENAEKKELTPTTAFTSSMGNIHVELPQGTFPTTTTQTTMSPGRFSHNFFHYVKNENDVFRLTIPITLTLFAVVDCTGYLSGNNDNPLRTNENFKEFFKQSIPPLDESDSSFLNHIFRQGLTHIYFPKLSVGISYHSTNPTEKLFFRNGKGVLILNVNRLEEIVTKTFMIIKENESLYPQMEDRYQDLISDYQDKYSATIANYEM